MLYGKLWFWNKFRMIAIAPLTSECWAPRQGQTSCMHQYFSANWAVGFISLSRFGEGVRRTGEGTKEGSGFWWLVSFSRVFFFLIQYSFYLHRNKKKEYWCGARGCTTPFFLTNIMFLPLTLPLSLKGRGNYEIRFIQKPPCKRCLKFFEYLRKATFWNLKSRIDANIMFAAGRFGNVVSDDSFHLNAFFSFFGCVSFSFTRNKRERNELNK